MKLHPMKMLKSGLNSSSRGPCCHPVTPVLNVGALGVRGAPGGGQGAGLSYPWGAPQGLSPSAFCPCHLGKLVYSGDNVHVYF